MRKLLLTLFSLFVALGATPDEPTTIDYVYVIERGIYRVGPTTEVPAPNTPSGKVSPAKDWKLIEATTTIPADMGTDFGIRFIVQGSPVDREVELTCITRFPPQGVTNPVTGKTFYTSEFKWRYTIGHLHHRTYGFDEPWELVPGEWSLEFWYEGRKLGEQKFIVVAAS